MVLSMRRFEGREADDCMATSSHGHDQLGPLSLYGCLGIPVNWLKR